MSVHAAKPERTALRLQSTTTRERMRLRHNAGRLVTHLVLIAITLVSMMPLLYMISTSLKLSGREFAFPIEWLPRPIVWGNYWTALTRVPTLVFLRNTMIITITATIGGILTSSLVAYGFARARFPGRGFLFMLVLSGMMLPYMVTMIPLFVLFRNLGWINTLLPLIVPAFFGGHPFYIFLLRQFFKGLPADLEDAAMIDGAGFFRIWWSIAMPLARPALATVAILSILAHWNDFTAPLVYLNTQNNWTLALGIRLFRDQYQINFNLMMAYAVIMTLPVFTVFFIFQKHFIQGITLTGMGGR
jgi:multiple sugar transport system permease protein